MSRSCAKSVRSKDINDAANVRLIAEVADASLRKDRAIRLRLSAQAGIPHYWIADINGRQVECWSDLKDGVYTKETPIAFGEPIPVPGTDETITLTAPPSPD